MDIDDAATGETGVELDPTYREAFEFLQSETRVDIMLALAEQFRSALPDEPPTLSFSELRKRVGVRDSGRFNYHLGQLESTLVEQTDDEYVLTTAGMQAVSTLVAGAFASGEERGPTPIGEECSTCGDQLLAHYHSGSLELVCDSGEDHGVSNLVPPGAALDRSMSELVEVLRVTSYHGLGQTVQGVCPLCRGSFEWTVHFDAMDSKPGYVGKCMRCAAVYSATPGMLTLYDSGVVAFFDRHGVDVHDSHLWRVGEVDDENVTVVSEDPTRVAVIQRADDDAFRVVLDGAGQVVETERLDG